jgi:hypothetical protein
LQLAYVAFLIRGYLPARVAAIRRQGVKIRDYGLGNAIADATAALGIEPCDPCKKRVQILNEVGRRGFAKGTALILLMMMTTVLEAAWQVAGGDKTLHYTHVLGFARTINTVAQVLKDETGVFPSRDALLGENGLLKHKRHAKPGTGTYEWASRLNFMSDEILPGWVFSYKTDGNEYTASMTSESLTIIWDDEASIYMSNVKPDLKPPSGGYGGRARDFPGALPWEEYISKQPPRARNGVKAFLTPGAGCATLGLSEGGLLGFTSLLALCELRGFSFLRFRAYNL